MTVPAQVAAPVSNLIDAAERVSKGDLATRVDASDAKDEIAVLSRTFNNMTERIDSQQQGLMAANTELDTRRQFTEAVLSGVSAGVVGLDAEGRINLPNRSASELLGMDLDEKINEKAGRYHSRICRFTCSINTPTRQASTIRSHNQKRIGTEDVFRHV